MLSPKKFIEGQSEKKIKVEFTIHKFSIRNRPHRKDIIIIPMFCEFGCETLGVLYSLPQLLQNRYSGKYVIIIGWYGRSYLYKHLVDEFWELHEEHQWLREYARAFHHTSKNLKNVEKQAAAIGVVIGLEAIGNVATYPVLTHCPQCNGATKMSDNKQICEKCMVGFPLPGLFYRVGSAKKEAVWLPEPSQEAMAKAKKFIAGKAVGITGRNRKTYGRNLPSIFYERLIYLLEDLGYQPIWMGEKNASLPCPLPRIINFSESPEAADLEVTLALVKQMKFTIQFWTASSRLAGMMGTPYIIFESPDQIWGEYGQEGMRISLCSKGDKKIVISHFHNCCENQSATLDLVNKAVVDMEEGNYEEIIGLVSEKCFVEAVRCANKWRVNGNNC